MVDTVIVQSAADGNKEDPKHIEEMVAKVDAAEKAAATTDTPDALDTPAVKPEWVPEKFWNAEKGEILTEALAKSYGELEAKQGGKKEAEAPADKKATEGETEAQKAAADELASKGLSLDDFDKEFQEKGSLSEESYAKLEKAGYPRARVDAFIAGQNALAERYTSEVKSIAGGEDGFAAMATWAAVNVDPKELAAYNKAVDSGDIESAKLAVTGIFQKYQQANPEEPHLLTPAGGKVTSDVYESREQLQADMSNPQYKKDPAFRKKVIAKLGRSNIL